MAETLRAQGSGPGVPFDPASLEFSLRRPRTLFSATLTVLVFALAFSAAVPLVSVLYELIVKGGGKLLREGVRFFIELPPAAGMEGGGIGNALLGTLKIVLPTAVPGIATGVMLAVARAAGETAPLLFTALFSDYWPTRNLMEPMASMAVLIYNFSSSPFPNQIEFAWAASLVLVFLVLLSNIAAQIYSSRGTVR